jgi:hypothetical protein
MDHDVPTRAHPGRAPGRSTASAVADPRAARRPEPFATAIGVDTVLPAFPARESGRPEGAGSVTRGLLPGADASA